MGWSMEKITGFDDHWSVCCAPPETWKRCSADVIENVPPVKGSFCAISMDASAFVCCTGLNSVEPSGCATAVMARSYCGAVACSEIWGRRPRVNELSHE